MGEPRHCFDHSSKVSRITQKGYRIGGGAVWRGNALSRSPVENEFFLLPRNPSTSTVCSHFCVHGRNGAVFVAKDALTAPLGTGPTITGEPVTRVATFRIPDKRMSLLACGSFQSVYSSFGCLFRRQWPATLASRLLRTDQPIDRLAGWLAAT